jgi:transposase
MAAIIKKIKKGRPYYYAVESKRLNGKPRIVWQKYLGTIDAIIQRADEAKPQAPKETVIFEAGGVAALLRITQRLGLIDLIDEVVSKRRQGPSVGHYMVLAALNRALAPCSKVSIGNWYEQTILKRLWRFPRSDFSSRRFRDHMDMVSEEAIETVQERLLPSIQKEFGIDPRVLLYDTTNFFTFLATTNDRSQLAQRGRSKAKRHDLRQIGLALLVTRDFRIPLLHKTYPGNMVDVSLFEKLSQDMIARYQKLTGQTGETTLVFDKGNVSDDGMENPAVSNLHFVAALSANRFPELLDTPRERFENLPDMPGTKVFTTTATVWGKSCKVVLAYTESFFTQQLCGITHNLVQCQKKLLDLGKALKKWRQGKGRGKRPTVKGIQKKVREILSAQFMKKLFQIQIQQDNGLPRLQYEVDHTALGELSDKRLGKTIIITDHLQWTSGEIVEAYRNLFQVEESFKNMKNIHFLHWQPAYHWTDQKVRVHGFYCVLALLLTSLARQIAIGAGIHISLITLLKELSAIREVAVIYPPGTLAHRKDHITLSRMSPRQKKLADSLQIGNILLRG